MPAPDHRIRHHIGDTVFLKIAQKGSPGLITGINLRPEGAVLYVVSWADCSESCHYALELVTEAEPSFH
jgi:hypothetical protein